MADSMADSLFDMADSTLFDLLYSAKLGNQAEKTAALAAATAYLLSRSPLEAGGQLMYQNEQGMGLLHLLARRFSAGAKSAALSTLTASFVALVIERSRESCGTAAVMSVTNGNGRTPLHSFASSCADLCLTKVVLREHPPSLVVLNDNNRFPLDLAEGSRGGSSEYRRLFRAAHAAFDASNFAALQRICGGPSPYLTLELLNQETALRTAVAICVNRQEEAPAALTSVKAAVALELLRRAREVGRVGNSSDLLRRILEYVGHYARSCDAD